MWLELASPDPGSLGAIRIWLLIYLAVTLAGALCCGDRWCARADPFEVYSVVASRLSALRRNADGRIAIGNPFDHLPSLPVRPGTVTLLAVLLGSTAFDSFSAMPQWRNFIDDALRNPTPTATLIRTAGLLVFIGVVAATFWLAARRDGRCGQAASPRVARADGAFADPDRHRLCLRPLPDLPGRAGQQTVILLLGLDADVNYILSLHPSVLATIKVRCVVAGHVAGVIAAHDRALRLLPKRHQLTGQLAMMLVMVGYTFTGLYLLFGG